MPFPDTDNMAYKGADYSYKVNINRKEEYCKLELRSLG